MSYNNNITNIYSSFGKIHENNWLSGRNFSDAFVLCVASGPWRSVRRKTIQGQAISFLAGRDLYDINSEVTFFPLAWQNSFTNSIIHTLQLSNKSMDKYCKLIQKELIIQNNRQILYNACRCPQGAKVLSLFCRDSLKLENCFPIDRHVKKFLQQYNLPTNETAMVKLCQANLISPRLFAIGVAQKMGIDNPDWSI